jgi:hypothetical protein
MPAFLFVFVPQVCGHILVNSGGEDVRDRGWQDILDDDARTPTGTDQFLAIGAIKLSFGVPDVIAIINRYIQAGAGLL